MANEQGREYNPETAQDLRSREFKFCVYGERFRYVLEIPEYILARLDSETMDKLQTYMERYCEKVIINAIRGGYLLSDEGRKSMSHDVGQHLKNYIWERFSIAQEKAGHDCWQTAPSLQEVLV